MASADRGSHRRPSTRTRTRRFSCSRSTTFTGISQRHAQHDPDGLLHPVTTRPGATSWAQKTVPAGGIEYLATHIKSLRRPNSNTITVGAGDLIGASPLVSGTLPRRADDRGDEPLSVSTSRESATTSSTRASTELLAASARTAATRSTAARTATPFPGAILPVPRRERLLQGTDRDDLPAVRDPQGRQREDRVHRTHARRHAARS